MYTRNMYLLYYEIETNEEEYNISLNYEVVSERLPRNKELKVQYLYSRRKWRHWIGQRHPGHTARRYGSAVSHWRHRSAGRRHWRSGRTGRHDSWSTRALVVGLRARRRTGCWNRLLRGRTHVRARARNRVRRRDWLLGARLLLLSVGLCRWQAGLLAKEVGELPEGHDGGGHGAAALSRYRCCGCCCAHSSATGRALTAAPTLAARRRHGRLNGRHRA